MGVLGSRQEKKKSPLEPLGHDVIALVENKWLHYFINSTSLLKAYHCTDKSRHHKYTSPDHLLPILQGNLTRPWKSSLHNALFGCEKTFIQRIVVCESAKKLYRLYIKGGGGNTIPIGMELWEWLEVNRIPGCEKYYSSYYQEDLYLLPQLLHHLKECYDVNVVDIEAEPG